MEALTNNTHQLSLDKLSDCHVIRGGKSHQRYVVVVIELRSNILPGQCHLGPPFGEWIKLYPAIFGGS